MAFNPGAHPKLTELSERLRELAGDAAFKAGRDYLKKGLVKQGVVAGTTAYATVTGSTEYRVSVAFGETEKVTCTCPAHRRSKYCKHVVAVAAALVDSPASFGEAEPPAEAPVEAKAKKTRTPKGKTAAQEKEENRTAGLATVDRLLEELTSGGLVTLGAEQASLLESAGELVRALKLRRLGNAILRLQRAAAGGGLEPADFARLLGDIYLTRAAVGAHLEGRVQLDPALAEELLGKTWRESELEPAKGLELIEVATTRESDGEFVIDTGYLADLTTGELYLEKAITPARMASQLRIPHRHRLLVDEAGLYPGPAPRRIRLARFRRAPLTLADVQRFLEAAATTDVTDLRRRLAERLASPFDPAQLAVAFRPAAVVTQGSLTGALDSAGRFLRLTLPDSALKELAPLKTYALVGLLTESGQGLDLQVLALVSPQLPGGPVLMTNPASRR